MDRCVICNQTDEYMYRTPAGRSVCLSCALSGDTLMEWDSLKEKADMSDVVTVLLMIAILWLGCGAIIGMVEMMLADIEEFRMSAMWLGPLNVFLYLFGK